MYIHFPLIVFEANAMNVMYNLVLYSQAIVGCYFMLNQTNAYSSQCNA